GAVIAEFVHLRVIQLDDADELRRAVEFAALLTQAAVGGEARMRGKPARDGGRADAVAVARGQAAADLFEGVAAIVVRERVEDLAYGIGLGAEGARAGREAAVASAAVIEADCFEFLAAAALGGDLRA